MKMRIAFISQYFYPEQFSNNDIAIWLTERGYTVKVVCCVPNYPKGSFFETYSNKLKRKENWNGIEIHRARTWARGQNKLSLLMNFLTFPILGSYTAFAKLRGDFDVIFVSMPSPLLQAIVGIFLKVIFRKPLVYWVQDIWPESVLYTLNIKNKAIIKLLQIFCGWIYRRADILLVQSAAFPPMIARFGIDNDRIRVFPNTAPDIRTVESSDFLEQFNVPAAQGNFNLLFAGNIGESQDFDTYIEAADILKKQKKNISWIIVGSGRDQKRVERLIFEKNLSSEFHFLGRFPEEDMNMFFSAADALLVGLKDNPIFSMTVPYKVQCYLASSTPIVASINGEGARIIDDAEAGVTAPAQSPEKLAIAINRIMDMSDNDRKKMGQNGRNYFDKNYSKEIVYSILEDALSKAGKENNGD